MKKVRLVISTIAVYALTQNSYAADIKRNIQNAFGNREVVINDYDDQLKEVVVDSKVYFATHDGRYLFAGPVLDTKRQVNIVSVKEGQLRLAYLSELPEGVFIHYPSNGPSKHQITVFTDIDCPYCRQFHAHMASFNQRGISVNYIMLPRTGVGSKSHQKTIAALCADDPATAITRAMQNSPLADIRCETSPMNLHFDIARNLRINSTPTIVLPSGELKLGLVNPDQLATLLDGAY